MNARYPGLLSYAKTIASVLCISLGVTLGSSLSAQVDPVVSVGDDFGAVVDASGNLFVWGAIASEVGEGEVQQILPSEQWRDVSVSRTAGASAHILAIQTDGTLWAWGSNTRGQVGDGSTVDRAEPFQVSSSTDWAEIAAGEFHSMARKADGRIYLWGGNSYGQLGFGPISNDPDLDIETSIGAAMDGNSYIAIAAGKLHSHAIRANGTLWAWGANGGVGTNYNGRELGFLVGGSAPVGPVGPTQIGSSTVWTDLFSGYDSVFATCDTANETGQLWVWGSGALGNGSPGGSSSVPVRVGNSSNWVSVSASKSTSEPHAIGLKSDGSLFGWGVNYQKGALGLPLTDDGKRLTDNYSKDQPFGLMTGDTFLAVGAGEGFSAVIRADGLLLTAGINDAGQLANGQTNDSVEGQDFFYNSNLGIADLQGESVTITTQLPWTLPSVSASFSMKNGGTGEITDDFYISAVLSPNANYDHESAIPLEFTGGGTELLVTDSLAAGQSLSVPFSFLLPDSVVRGDYYVVVQADSTDVIVETDEDNNDGATVDSYEFYPDLIVESLVVGGGIFIPGNDLTIDVELKNQGVGTITAGTTFEMRLFLSPDKTPDNSAAVDLDADVDDTLVTVYTVELASDFDPGDVIALDTFELEVPRMSGGFYFVGADVDVSELIQEQTEIVINNVVAREDGEDNNLTFTATATVQVVGIDIPIAIDQELLTFTTSGDGEWFGQNSVYNEAVVGNNDAVQSPSLAVGDWAAFSTDLDAGATPYAITFDWKSETSSIDNKLIYRVVNGATGGLFNEISGITEWTTVQRVVPANARAEWVYEKGTDANGDAVYVDNLQVTEVTLPDLVIDDVYLPDGAAGSYVLLKDKLDLTVNSRNQGTDTALDDGYVISIYLSKDRTFDRPDSNPATADDILIRQEVIPGGIASGDPAVNGLSILLDAALDDGDYYVIGYIDDYTDANGDLLPGAVDPSGQVLEFVDGAISFDGEANNLFVSSGTIEIVALPDLIVSELNATPDYYLIEDPLTGEANSMEFDFTVANIGLTAVNSNVATHVLFSEDQVIEPESDYLLLDYNYNGNFGALDDAPANERLISPDAIDFREDLIDAGYIGRRLFVGVYIDSDLEIDELDEDHNSSYLLNNDFILSELPIEVGLDIDSTTMAEQNITVINDEIAPYDSELIPWVGQTTESVDGFDAVTNVIVSDNETSQFSLNIEPTTGIRVSFWWKVSSEYNLVNGVTHVDTLNFEVDGVEAVAPIFGTDDEEWRRVEVSLEPGVHTLTWSYVKDDQGSEGEDRGWVDNLVIEELPNLTVTGVTANGIPVYAGGDTIDTWSVTIQNTGADIEAGTSFDVPVRLLPGDSWSESSGVVDLLMITDPNTAGMAAGETRTYNATEDLGSGALGALTLPDVEYTQEFYFLGAYVDWSLADLDNGQIIEFDETDNSAVTDLASIQLGLPDMIGRPIPDGGGVTGVDPGGYDFVTDNDVDLTLHLLNTGDGVLVAGSEFEVVVYAATISIATELGSSDSYELDRFTVTTASDVASGDPLDDIDVVSTLPYGIPIGSYYVGVIIDSTNTVEEQGALPSALRPDDVRADGEGNNIYFTAAPEFIVSGITVEEGMDLASGSFEFDGDADWFGRDDAGDPDTVDDEQTFFDGDGAQSPVLLVGEAASFSLAVADSSTVKFDWAANTLSDSNALSVLVNGEVIRVLTGESALATVEPFVVPDGATVRWVYTKGADTVGDVAYLDHLELLPNSLPDLALTDVSYVAGEYVLDRESTFTPIDDEGNPLYLQTKFLDIGATAENQGADLAASSGAFTSADIEVRLSVNNVYGDADDVILGSFAQVEGDFDSTNLLSFFGPITLGDHIPEGFYHLIVRFDSNDRVDEFTESNNMFISELADVQITRLPDLIIENLELRDEDILVDEILRFSDIIDVDETQRYNPESSVRMRFNIQNIGLGDVSGAESFTTQVNLRGIPRPELDEDPLVLIEGEPPYLSDLFAAATDPIILQEFDIQDELNGRSYDSGTGVFDGESKSVDIELFLPAGNYLNAVIDADKSIQDYVWFFEVIVNRDFPFDETDTYNTWWCVDADTLMDQVSTDWIAEFNGAADDGVFGIEFTPTTTNSTYWESDYGVDVTDPDMLLAYAFNRNPASGDTAGNQFPGSSGIIRIEGETDADDEDFLSVTFDFVALSTDLKYEVVADNVVTFDDDPVTLLTIDTGTGKYTDAVGPKSLTGEGGLVEVDNVISVHDQGYAARVTVMDILPTSVADSRFIRIVVSLHQSVEAFVIDEMNQLGESNPAEVTPDYDFDLDTVSNLVELLYGTDPTDIGDVPGIVPAEQGVATDMAYAIVAFGDSLTVPTPDVGSSDDYDSDGSINALELLLGTDPADPLDF